VGCTAGDIARDRVGRAEHHTRTVAGERNFCSAVDGARSENDAARKTPGNAPKDRISSWTETRNGLEALNAKNWPTKDKV
jgi:hypothetical protein